jgi:pimeloyl-ACP methyl ester carboxylesterase
MTIIALALAVLLAGQTPASTTTAQLATPTGTLAGTLVVPPAAAKVPVVLIIPGSGPTDRDGNTPLIAGKNNSYKMLADALAAEGVASLRYDKRGIGESRTAIGREADMRFDMSVDDAAGWVAQLRGDARFSRVIVAGHSEGSLVGMLASAKAHADAFVSIAGPARRASIVMRDQLRPQLGATPALWEGSETVLAMLEAGSLVTPLPLAIRSVPSLASLYRPSVQPYLISWFKYVPSSQLAALTIPVVILQGTTDLQVSVDEAKALKAAKPDAELIVIDGMNHVMKRAPADPAENIAAYGNPDLPIVPDVPKAIIDLARRK